MSVTLVPSLSCRGSTPLESPIAEVEKVHDIPASWPQQHQQPQGTGQQQMWCLSLGFSQRPAIWSTTHHSKVAQDPDNPRCSGGTRHPCSPGVNTWDLVPIPETMVTLPAVRHQRSDPEGTNSNEEGTYDTTGRCGRRWKVLALKYNWVSSGKRNQKLVL